MLKNADNALYGAVEHINTDILDIWKEGNCEQDVRFLKQSVETVLQELLADKLLAGCQHLPSRSKITLVGTLFWALMPMVSSLSSWPGRLALTKVGQGKVPISLVLYIRVNTPNIQCSISTRLEYSE